MQENPQQIVNDYKKGKGSEVEVAAYQDLLFPPCSMESMSVVLWWTQPAARWACHVWKATLRYHLPFSGDNFAKYFSLHCNILQERSEIFIIKFLFSMIFFFIVPVIRCQGNIHINIVISKAIDICILCELCLRGRPFFGWLEDVLKWLFLLTAWKVLGPLFISR